MVERGVSQRSKKFDGRTTDLVERNAAKQKCTEAYRSVKRVIKKEKHGQGAES